VDGKFSSETSVDFQRRYVPEDRPLNNHRCENLESELCLFLKRNFIQNSLNDATMPAMCVHIQENI
jgi:hypothetical protein